jgi:hypothetical protein
MLVLLRQPVRIPGFRVQFSGLFPTSRETKRGLRRSANLAGFGSLILDPPNPSRLAAFSVPGVPVGRPDTPSGTRFASAPESLEHPRTAPKRRLSGVTGSPEFFIRNSLNTVLNLLYARPVDGSSAMRGRLGLMCEPTAVGRQPHIHIREIPRLEART